MIGGQAIKNFSDVVRAGRRVSQRIGEWVEVRWQSVSGPKVGHALVARPPLSSYLGSVLWFLLEMLIFAVGARVVWKRPQDDSARVFFWLCVVTVVAYMGGYHWLHLASEPSLIFPFAALVVFVPILSLHFYLIFPRPNPIFARHGKLILSVLYGLPFLTALGLWLTMSWSRWGQNGQTVDMALLLMRSLSLGYVGLSVVVFFLCLPCLIFSYRHAASRAERNQVRWILLATILAIPPVLWLLWDASIDPARLGMSRSAWPMSIVSLLYTVAYAFSITRYKLMQAEDLLNRSVVYVALSITAGVLYSAGLVIGAMVIGERLLGNQASLGTVVACVTATILLILSGAARNRFQKVIDRRFYREKYQFDKAMRKMRLAVGSLVDRPTLGRTLLEAASDVLHADWGALYLSDHSGTRWSLAASSGAPPDERVLQRDNDLIARFRSRPDTLKVPHAMSRAPGSDAATDAMIALGGEVATPLESEGDLAGLLILGPKRSGMPYEEEEIAFLGALGSVATLALRSAGIQDTLESLNNELREKVEKISEQQRRILALQEQLSLQRSAGRGEEREGAGPNSDAQTNGPHLSEDSSSTDTFGRTGPFMALRGSSHSLKGLISLARKVAGSRSAILIRGESGTGKELLAEAIHRSSPRADKPFVKVHCAALSQSLLESELFGHVKGAFTDAKTDRQGRFQQADGGSLFLDEIGDINLEVQTKLLRVLQEMAFEKVGSSQTISVDVRIIAATHQDLEALIRAGRFREDLYYRLNVISLRTPALRERKEDIFELALGFLDTAARRIGKTITSIDDTAIEALMAHEWPGNIRELENAIERAVVLAERPVITVPDLPPELQRHGRRRNRPVSEPAWAMSSLALVGSTRNDSSQDRRMPSTVEFRSKELNEDLDSELLAYERHRLLEVMTEAGGNKSEAARLLGMPRSTFFSKLKKHRLA
jgi:transcriptional regulator with GAF, ATPase, and Fis domain